MERHTHRNSKSQKKIPAKSIVALIIVLAICIGVIWKIVSQQITLSNIENIAKGKEQSIADEKLENQKLQDQYNQVKENPDEYIQRQAREKLGLVKPNERVFVDISQ